jgi:hypothetical protein
MFVRAHKAAPTFVFKPEHGPAPQILPTHLDSLHLLADSTQHVLPQSVELVKAAPGSAAQQTNKNAAHGTNVKLFVTIEHQHLQQTAQHSRCPVLGVAVVRF